MTPAHTNQQIRDLLAKGEPQSISRLAQGSALTRQAITKHLRVLEGAGVVRSVRAGRESLFAFRPEPLRELRRVDRSLGFQQFRDGPTSLSLTRRLHSSTHANYF